LLIVIPKRWLSRFLLLTGLRTTMIPKCRYYFMVEQLNFHFHCDIRYRKHYNQL
jgi:hypothetical protein